MNAALRTMSVLAVSCSMLVACSTQDAGDQAEADDALLVLADFDAGWSEVAEAEDADADAEVKRKVAKCVGADEPTAGDFGGAMARSGIFTNPAGVAVAETVSFAADRTCGRASPQ